MFLPIQWRLADLRRQGFYEQAFAEIELWERENPGPETAVQACRFRALLVFEQYGPCPEAGLLYREAFQLARRLRPGIRAIATIDLLAFSQLAGDEYAFAAAYRTWCRLFRSYGDDQEVRQLYPYACHQLAQRAAAQGHTHSAVAWYDRVAANPHELEDITIAAWSLALAAHECIKQGRLTDAAQRLARARELMPPDLHSSEIIPCVDAELAVAEGRFDAAIESITAVSPVNLQQPVRVLAACVMARLYGALGRDPERQRWTEHARDQLKPHAPVWLRREVDMVQAH